jgi:ABC-2 type transport system ATP-binding protein
MSDAIELRAVEFSYGERLALAGVDLTVHDGECFALLGPNGSGKSTLFRLLTTMAPVQRGEVRVAGCDCRDEPAAVRQRIGVVFQSPSLDPQLTVAENLHCQGALYGLYGAALADRISAVLSDFGLSDRRHERSKTLSGGLKRRVELAKSVLHRPEVLLLDEPSTGLDPGARLDLWQVLMQLRGQGTTILLTTHLLEEAEKADRLAILNHGRVIACDSAPQLRGELGPEVLTVHADDPVEALAVGNALGLEGKIAGQAVWLRGDGLLDAIPEYARRLGDRAHSLTIAQPSLEDVFLARTGSRFFTGEGAR